MASTQSLSIRHQQYLELFHDHLSDLLELHRQSIQELLPQLIISLNLSTISTQLVTKFLSDKLNLFRFLKRNKFDIDSTISALSDSIQWRLESNLDYLSPSSLDSTYLDHPLFLFHSELKDKWGRNCAIINLKYLTRTQDGSLDSLKEFIAWNLELARRSIYESNHEQVDRICPSSSQFNIPLQFSLIVDLKDASMSNLEVELLPYLVHLIKNNFPDMVGAIFILNYGWMYAGMWQIVKRVLTQSTLDRIVFPSNQTEILKFFDRSNLLVEHGGSVVYNHSADYNPSMNRFGKPASRKVTDLTSTPETIHPLSRHSSVESIHDIFFSAVNTPHYQLSRPGTPNRSGGNSGHHHRQPSWLNMTSYHPSQISSSSLSEAVKISKDSHQAWHSSYSSQNFQLRLPTKKNRDEMNDEASEASTAPILTPGRLSTVSSSSSSLESEKDFSLLLNHTNVKDVDDQDVDESDNSLILHSKASPTVKLRRKRDYLGIKLIIKFGYVLRSLQLLARLLTRRYSNQRVIHPGGEDDSAHRGRGALAADLNKNHDHHRHVHLNHLFLLLNLQRKKMISSFGFVMFFLLIFLKKRKP